MTRTYAVMLDGKEAAQALCAREGLYYLVECGCRLEAGARYHLMAQGDSGTEDLGLLVPEGGLFQLRRRVPVKRLGEGQLRFFLAGQGAEQKGEWVPVEQDAPFAYLHRLDGARLVIRDGKPGILLPEKEGNG